MKTVIILRQFNEALIQDLKDLFYAHLKKKPAKERRTVVALSSS